MLHPGDAFEYMSSCQVQTAKGIMQGNFSMAPVPLETPSAQIGTRVPAFSSPQKFQVTVNPFPLEATNSEMNE